MKRLLVLTVLLAAGALYAEDAPAPKPEEKKPQLTSVFYQLSPVEKAQQQMIEKAAKPYIKESLKLLTELQKLLKDPKANEARIKQIDARLNELSKLTAEVGKTAVMIPTQ
jgi:molecular chaperone DnaK (HSP70)